MSLDPISAALDLGSELIKRFFPDPEMQAKELLKLNELAQKGELAELNSRISLLMGQVEINKIEAASGNWFVSSWRPFIGWICGFALAYAAILEPLMRFIARMSDYSGTFPVIDTQLTLQILLGMLGLAGMRTHEKRNNVASHSEGNKGKKQ